ncbi:hypothetical protein GGR54DRAFT_633416 [Hypoxylon sp. NC1633]|nr:hypothetical protein GGR54DRAFT_633416 [Hypoxylon sp. NC1633]
MFSRRWSFSTTNRHTEPPSHHRDGRNHRPRHRDSPDEKKKIDLVDLDFPMSGRHNVKIGTKDISELSQLTESLKKRFPDGEQRIPEDAQVKFYHVDKPLSGDAIPGDAQTLLYRVLPSGDDGALRVIWRGTNLKLRRHQTEAISKEAKSGRSEDLVKSPNQIIVEAGGGLRPGPLQGSAWEARKVRTWLCRYLILDIRPVDDYFIFRGFNEEYIWHRPYRSPRGFADVHMLKHWMKHEVLTSVHHRGIRRRGVEIEDIKLVCRGRVVRKHSHLRPGETIDFEVPRVIEDSFIRAEAWLVPLSETCIVCSDEKRVSEMPNKRRITAACEHDSSTCKECVAQWITSSLETITWDRLKCPECPQLLKYENVRALATREAFDRYDTLAAKALLAAIPEFTWCLNPRCKSGQIFLPGCERAKCHACKHYFCVRHSVPWHRGETCDEYEHRTRRQRRNDKASEKAVKEITKPCPGCNKNVDKYTGCDHVTCVCGHEWCWLCCGGYYRDEHNFLQCHHKRECQYHDNPPNYEGGRAFMPFLDMEGGPPQPPFIPPPPPRERRAAARPPAAPRAHMPDEDVFGFLMPRHNRNPFNPNMRINVARGVVPPGFLEDAQLLNMAHLMRR